MKKPFCLAPWIHSFRAPNGERRLCCHARLGDENTYEIFEDYWNSSYLKDVRKKMLEGKPPEKECQSCLHKENTLAPPYISFDFERKREEEILSQTEEDGTYHQSPTYLDYRVRNTCNLSCRTCNGLFTSQIDKKNSLIDAKAPAFDQQDALNAQKEWRELAKNPIKRCYFAGGEAFLQGEHFEDLQCLTDRHSITLNYNTNLSFSLEAIKKQESLFKSFKAVNLAVSIDGAKNSGEFVRSGLSWNRFVKNIEEAKSLPYLKITQFDITLTLPTLLELEDLADFLLFERKPYNVTKVLPGGYASLVSLELLEENDLNELLFQKIEMLKNKDAIFFLPFIQYLEEYQKAPKDSFPLKDLITSYQYSLSLDQAFKREPLKDFYRNYPKALKIIVTIEEAIESEHQKHISPEMLYWEDLLQQKGYKKENFDFYIHCTVPDQVSRPSVVIGSYPSLLNQLLSANNIEKFSSLKLFKSNQVELLGPFSYLLRNKKPLLYLGKALDILTIPMRKLLAFHFIARI